MTKPSSRPAAVDPQDPGVDTSLDTGEHFKPVGTAYLLAIFVAMLILLWGSVYLILLSRGTTV